MRTCVCRAHSPISESVQSLPYSAPARGFPSPSSEIPARPLPTLPRRESGRAGDKETPASLHSPSFYPPETLPGALPRPRRHRARTHAGEGTGGTGSRVGESAFPTPRGYSRPCTPPGDTPRQPRPHHPLPKASRAPDTAIPSPNLPHHPSSGATGGRGAHKADGECGARGEEEIPPGLAAPARGGYLPDFFFDLRDVCEDEEDHKQRERGQHPAPELQLHGGVGALRDPRAGRGEELGLEEPPRSTRSGAHTLHSGRVRAGGDRGDSGSERQTGVAQARRARSLSLLPAPPLSSLLLFSPPFPPPRTGLPAQFDSFAPRLAWPPPTNSSGQPAALAAPTREGSGSPPLLA